MKYYIVYNIETGIIKRYGSCGEQDIDKQHGEGEGSIEIPQRIDDVDIKFKVENGHLVARQLETIKVEKKVLGQIDLLNSDQWIDENIRNLDDVKQLLKQMCKML